MLTESTIDVNGGSPDLAWRIVDALGGYKQLSTLLGIPPRTVRAWYLQGIPRKFHKELLQVARWYHCGELVTAENLQLTSVMGKHYRCNHIRRLPPSSAESTL